MSYSELLEKALVGTAFCNKDVLTCHDCPYFPYGAKVDQQSHCMDCQRALLHDKNVLVNIMKYLDKIQDEVTGNG